MSNPSLTDRDLTLLVVLSQGPADAAALGRRADLPADALDERLSVLVDNGLVRATDGRYEVTDSGRRVIDAPEGGGADVDVPDAVRDAFEARDLRADRLDAALAAFGFLRYWGTATGPEIADGAFAEAPLEYDTPGAWWREFARDHLAAVPTVDPPDDEAGFWRFDGRPGIADIAEDGRNRLFDHGEAETYASATEAMVAVGLPDDDRRAVAAALGTLQCGETVETDALRTVLADADPEADPDDLLDALERLPGVVRDGDRWRDTLGPDGYEAGA